MKPLALCIAYGRFKMHNSMLAANTFLTTLDTIRLFVLLNTANESSSIKALLGEIIIFFDHPDRCAFITS